MLKKVTITNYLGDSIEYLIDGVVENNPGGLIITSIDGLGPVKAVVNMTDLTTTDGAVWNSSRLEKRNIVLKGEFTHATSIEESRLLTYKYFPIKKPLIFTIETDNRRGQTVGYVESNEPDIFSEKSSCSISILCESPFFESADGNDVYQFSAIKPMFRFPYKNDGMLPVTRFGEIIMKRENEIFYNGDYETGIIIKINAIGDARNINVFNTVTGEQMILDTSKLAGLIPNTGTSQDPDNNKLINGDEIDICTISGSKSISFIRNGKSYNILNILDKNSNWFQLIRGSNNFTYYAEDGDENIRFTIYTRVLYEGV